MKRTTITFAPFTNDSRPSNCDWLDDAQSPSCGKAHTAPFEKFFETTRRFPQQSWVYLCRNQMAFRFRTIDRGASVCGVASG